MIFDITYTDRMVNLEMARLVGWPFGWLSKERWQGIGSERCKVVSSSDEVDEIFNGDYKRNFTNIELRPKGIVIRIRYRLEVFAIAIPYAELRLENANDGLKIGTDRFSLVLVTAHGRMLKQPFLEKMLKFSQRGE